MSFLTNSTPCMRLPPAKFELTNQDSEARGWECAVLTSMCVNRNRKGIALAHLFSLYQNVKQIGNIFYFGVKEWVVRV